MSGDMADDSYAREEEGTEEEELDETVSSCEWLYYTEGNTRS